MKETIFSAPEGDIHYWTDLCGSAPMTLIFLPGLTADHRLFQQQLEAFAGRWNLLVWDAPGHGASRPFALDFTLQDKARWLHEILQREGIRTFCLIGQSMGGYVAQRFLQDYPDEAAGFVSIDSAPVKRRYYADWELWLLRRCQPVYQVYPWQALRQAVLKGCAETIYGQALMRQMMDCYTHQEFAALTGHGFRILADAIDENLPYRMGCPVLLLCGKHDHAGMVRRYNRAWSRGEELPLVWVPDAGHNANADNPAFVNRQIESFVRKLRPAQ